MLYAWFRQRPSSGAAARPVWARFARTIGLLLLAVVHSSAGAAVYYLDAANGNDGNPGTSSAPWKTLARAYTWYSGDGPTVQEGDTVFLRTGEYGQFIESTNVNPGERYLIYRDDWVTYRADTGHRPVLTKITIQNLDKWEPLENGRSYLHFESLRITDGVAISSTSYVRLVNCEVTRTQEPYQGPYAPYVRPGYPGVGVGGSSSVTIQGNNIHNSYRGISVGGVSDVNIVGNYIHRIGEDGMSVSGTDLTITGNHITDICQYRTTMDVYGHKTGDFTQGETVTLQGTAATGTVYRYHNNYLQVWQTGETALRSEWKEGRGSTLVGQTSGATVSVTGMDPAHTDGIQIMPGSRDVVFARNQIVRNSGGGLDGQGLKMDDPVNILIENNLVDSAVPLLMEGALQCRFLNNTFLGGKGDLNTTYAPIEITQMFNLSLIHI